MIIYLNKSMEPICPMFISLMIFISKAHNNCLSYKTRSDYLSKTHGYIIFIIVTSYLRVINGPGSGWVERENPSPWAMPILSLAS